MGKILVVEDEASIREVERAYLERAGHIVIEAETGTEAMAKFKGNVFDLIILDLNLPEIDGISVCKKNPYQ